MNHNQFEQILDKIERRNRNTLCAKAAEYSTGSDERFENFIDASVMNDDNCTVQQSMWRLATKHLASIKKMVRDSAKGIIPSESAIAEKFGDAQNYMYLLEARFHELCALSNPETTAQEERTIAMAVKTKPTLNTAVKKAAVVAKPVAKAAVKAAVSASKPAAKAAAKKVAASAKPAAKAAAKKVTADAKPIVKATVKKVAADVKSAVKATKK